MRLSTEPAFDQALAGEVIAAAAAAGVTVFDTARAYGHGEAGLGDNERLVAGALARCGAAAGARIVTKGGMARTAGAWVPDGRAKAILADCEASLIALNGLPIDMYLLHAPDPRTPWQTSVRALARLADEGLVRRVGLSNVNRRQLDEALELAPVAAVEVALSPQDHRALRGGIIEHCSERGIAVIAHSPLGGPRHAGPLARSRPLGDVAEAHGVTAAEVALAWLLTLSDAIIAIPGARRPETARRAADAGRLSLDAADLAVLHRAFGSSRPARLQGASRRDGAEVVMIMGIPGAGKTRLAQDYVDSGFLRLNRDERGGTLREIAGALDEQLSAGVRRVVLDNTFLSRAARSYVIEAADRHGVTARCMWLSTSLAQAQVNLVGRLLDVAGTLPEPDELRALARVTEGVMAPTSQMRALRELEPPSTDEGFADVEVVPFSRAGPSEPGRTGVFVAAAALRQPGWNRAVQRGAPEAPHLIFDWTPGGAPDVLGECVARVGLSVSGPVDSAACRHGAGPPRCWCRPPLPGLPLAFARAHRLEPSRSVLIGTGAAHRTLATMLGARYIPVLP